MILAPVHGLDYRLDEITFSISPSSRSGHRKRTVSGVVLSTHETGLSCQEGARIICFTKSVRSLPGLSVPVPVRGQTTLQGSEPQYSECPEPYSGPYLKKKKKERKGGKAITLVKCTFVGTMCMHVSSARQGCWRCRCREGAAG